MLHKTLLVMIFLLIGCCLSVYAEEEAAIETTRAQEYLEKIGQLNEIERLSGIRLLMNDQRALQERLLSYLSPETPTEVKFVAVFLLGYYKMDEAVDPLADNITLTDNSKDKAYSKLPLWGRYPAAEALARIGVRAVPRMIHNIKTSEDAEVRKVSTNVLRVIYGKAIGKFVLENELKGATDELTKKRIDDALLLMN